MIHMPLIIPDETLRAVGMTEEELRREMAIVLFSQGKLTLSRAARLAELAHTTFQRLLADRQIPIHYDVEEFRQDIKTLQGVGLL
jgi:predicted HTH domain antitoxin